MRRLYPKVKSVILWLGEPHTHSDLYKGLDLLQNIAGSMIEGHFKVEYETVLRVSWYIDIGMLKFQAATLK